MQPSADPVTLFLLSIAAIFLIGALGEVTFQRTNIPDVIWLMLAGILLGPILNLVTPQMLRTIAPYFAALTLVVVLFEGGSALRLNEVSHSAPRATLLSLVSFSTSVLALAAVSKGAAAVGWLPREWTWTHGLLLGAILGGSSAIIVMPTMARARLPAKLANLINLESALTDALCVVGTSAVIDVLTGEARGADFGIALLRSYGIGLTLGCLVGFVWLLFLRYLHSSEHAYPVALAVLLILYVVIDAAGGSAVLGILMVAVMLGNAPSLGRVIGFKEPIELDTGVRGFHRQLTFMVKSFFFVFIGAMLVPPWGLLGLGVLLACVLFVARIPAVQLVTWGGGFTPEQRRLVVVSLPRGMVAGVLATLPAARGVPGTELLPVVVFACVLTTILMFAVGFPMVRSKLPIELGDPLPTPGQGPTRALTPTPEQLRRGAIPRAPRTGFEEGAPSGDSFEPDPRTPHPSDVDELKV